MMFHVTVYHNTDGLFTAFRREHHLLPALAFSRAMPHDTTAEQLAEWTFCLFNADPDTLVGSRPTADTASAFLIACRYRLQRLRSLSVGDVVQVSTATGACWLACDGLGWCVIAPPPNVHAGLTDRPVLPGGSDQRDTEPLP